MSEDQVYDQEFNIDDGPVNITITQTANYLIYSSSGGETENRITINQEEGKVDNTPVSVTIRNIHIKTAAHDAIMIRDWRDEITIICSGNNTIKSEGMGIYLYGYSNVQINQAEEGAKLSINARDSGISFGGAYNPQLLSIKGCQMHIESSTAEAISVINLEVKQCKLTATSQEGTAIHANDVTVSQKCKLTATSGENIAISAINVTVSEEGELTATSERGRAIWVGNELIVSQGELTAISAGNRAIKAVKGLVLDDRALINLALPQVPFAHEACSFALGTDLSQAPSKGFQLFQGAKSISCTVSEVNTPYYAAFSSATEVDLLKSTEGALTFMPVLDLTQITCEAAHTNTIEVEGKYQWQEENN